MNELSLNPLGVLSIKELEVFGDVVTSTVHFEVSKDNCKLFYQYHHTCTAGRRNCFFCEKHELASENLAGEQCHSSAKSTKVSYIDIRTSATGANLKWPTYVACICGHAIGLLGIINISTLIMSGCVCICLYLFVYGGDT